MAKATALEKELRRLEEQLLCRGASSSEAAALLADNFVEFGSSGAILNKERTLQALQIDASARSLSDFSVVELAPGIALVRYRATLHHAGRAPAYSLRSSLWKRLKGRWQMVFHQGTLSSEQGAL